MSEIVFRAMRDLKDEAKVVAMMQALYTEDPPESAVDVSRFRSTIRRFVEQPSCGQVVVFYESGVPSGYALLVPFWSNEFGGNLLFVDEIYVKAGSRNRGIGRQFFQSVSRERRFDAVALALEVSPANARARRLYESLGFRHRSNSMLVCKLP